MFYIAFAVGGQCEKLRRKGQCIAKSNFTVRGPFFKTLAFFISTNKEDIGQKF